MLKWHTAVNCSDGWSFDCNALSGLAKLLGPASPVIEKATTL